MSISLSMMKILANKKKKSSGVDYVVVKSPCGEMDLMYLKGYEALKDKSKFKKLYSTKK